MRNGADDYTAGLAELRRQYLAERREGETCAEWIARTGRKFGRTV